MVEIPIFYTIEITVKTNHYYVHMLPISDTHVESITKFYLEFYPRWSQMLSFS